MTLEETELEEGLHYNMPEEKYFDIPAIHNSFISTFIKKSPRHAIHQFLNDSKPTKAQKTGSMLHKALLEPQKFKQDVVPYLSGNGRRKRVRNSKKLIKKLYPNATHYVKYSKYENYQDQVSEAVDNEIGQSLFTNLKTEVTMLVEDPETGLLLKCKWDAINFEKMVGFDYKTTRDANPRKFKWDLWKYGYYRQLAFYMYVAELLGYNINKFLILAQEKKEPYVAVWFDLFAGAITKGREEIKETLKDIKKCMDNNEFKGYVNPTTKRNIIQIDLPEKAYMIDEEF